jgi:hypothetical protein
MSTSGGVVETLGAPGVDVAELAALPSGAIMFTGEDGGLRRIW